jgi:hypothetical protein
MIRQVQRSLDEMLEGGALSWPEPGKMSFHFFNVLRRACDAVGTRPLDFSVCPACRKVSDAKEPSLFVADMEHSPTMLDRLKNAGLFTLWPLMNLIHSDHLEFCSTKCFERYMLQVAGGNYWMNFARCHYCDDSVRLHSNLPGPMVSPPPYLKEMAVVEPHPIYLYPNGLILCIYCKCKLTAVRQLSHLGGPVYKVAAYDIDVKTADHDIEEV